MAVSANTIIDGAAQTLLDEANITWTRTELLGYLNEGIRATVAIKPETYVVTGAVTLVAGVLQTLPAGAVALLDITHNVSGRAISVVDRELLDEAYRFWARGTTQAEVEHYTTDTRDPTRFTVYPPNDGTGQVVALYGAIPAEITVPNVAVPLAFSEKYESALIAFLLYRAYAKQSKRYDPAKSQAAKQDWAMSIGMTTQSQIAVAPKVAAQPGVT